MIIRQQSLRFILAVFLLWLALVPSSLAADAPKARLEHEFQAAVAQYESGHFPEAAQRLESLVRELPQSFDVHELLGLVYSAQSLDMKASSHLQTAVRLKPDSASARTNLAANLMRLGKADLAGLQFKKAASSIRQISIPITTWASLTFGPENCCCRTVSRSGPEHRSVVLRQWLRLVSGLCPERAARGCPAIGARSVEKKEHSRAAQSSGRDRREGRKFRRGANQYETAAHMDPSESNLFDWGSELLIARTLAPAIEVFQHATERYPKSPRLVIGLGMALYSRGNYDDAVKSLLQRRPRPVRSQLLPFSIQGVRQFAGPGQ